MFLNRLKLPLACLVICLVSAVGIGLTHFAAAGQADKKQPLPEQPVKKPKIDEVKDDLTLKLKGKWINVDKDPHAAKRIIIENKDD